MREPSKRDSLRERAEQIVSEKQGSDEAGLSKDLKRLVHELQVHQIELEMQNEELSRAQAEIEESRGKYVDLYDFSPVGYFTFTEKGMIAEVNLTGARMLGVEREGLRGRIFGHFVAPDDREAFLEHRRKVLESKKKECCELKLFKKDGTFSRVCLESIAADGGEGPTVRSAMIDITERVAAEEQRIRLVSAVERATESMIITDLEGKILYANPAFETFSGNSRQGVIGKSYFETMRKEGVEEDWLKNLREAMARGEGWTGQLTRKRKDQSALELRTVVFPARDDAGRTIHYLIMENDVSTEAALQDRLRQAQKMEALGTLAGGIAHDFNNLLMPIILNTEGALADALEGKIPSLDTLQMTIDAAERGRQLVKQILTFSRLKEQQRRPVEITPIIREALRFLRSAIPRTVEFQERLEAESAWVFADPSQMHQVLMNLYGNAAYAMRDKGGILETSLSVVGVDAHPPAELGELTPGSYLRLTVRDTGPGMDRAVREKAFDPFFTTKPPGEGSGMGLAMVYGIVKKHEGAVSLESEPGKGTKVSIFLPLLQESGPKQGVSSAAKVPRGKERILLVDDEGIQVKALRAGLERLGYRVVAETNPRQALEIFRSRPDSFNLVITDQAMPELPGDQLARELLRLRPDIPIILCTGFSERIDEAEARAIGIRNFALKPFSLRELAGMIKKVLEG